MYQATKWFRSSIISIFANNLVTYCCFSLHLFKYRSILQRKKMTRCWLFNPSPLMKYGGDETETIRGDDKRRTPSAATSLTPLTARGISASSVAALWGFVSQFYHRRNILLFPCSANIFVQILRFLCRTQMCTEFLTSRGRMRVIVQQSGSELLRCLVVVPGLLNVSLSK